MKEIFYLANACFVAILLFSSAAMPAGQGLSKQIALLKINKEYDKRTVIKNSKIPNAGNGLFAGTKFKKGEVIGELGGRLVADNDPSLGNHYIASIAECAREKSRPYKYIDSKKHGAHVSRINFAPSKINGLETHFQNAAIKQLCEPPYLIFVALKEIEPGTEILASYGPNYDYESFMRAPEVRDYFCGLLKLDCREKFSYSH